MESSLPESLTSTPLAPVAFVGLDAPTGRHASIWQAFTAERSPDRVPLKVRSSKLFYQFSKPCKIRGLPLLFPNSIDDVIYYFSSLRLVNWSSLR